METEKTKLEKTEKAKSKKTESNLISILERTINELNDKLKKSDEILSKINIKIRSIDFCMKEIDITKRFGFDGDNVYYIGVGSGRIYKKPINDDILNKIENVNMLTWKEIGEMGDYFMNNLNK